MCSLELKLQFILSVFFNATQRIQMSFQVKASLFILKEQFTSVIHIIIENKNFCKKNLHKIL